MISSKIFALLSLVFVIAFVSVHGGRQGPIVGQSSGEQLETTGLSLRSLKVVPRGGVELKKYKAEQAAKAERGEADADPVAGEGPGGADPGLEEDEPVDAEDQGNVDEDGAEDQQDLDEDADKDEENA
uniref:Secreted protein n=1 Tax=Tetraselmis sp. GSL018 TaxID=582737 RepID=A0A061RUU5_9CHLO|eukprot:CAMPEP_0177613772 /NCGR_PEP_ID=MMETSP0419_2-20121207/22220_1 /TAXON_ID=582737 /ORGANISM="Tetraselmis sp., Strain GSL018" /LENGTH=127 /DNA_ID=CAMNT_0019110625 /DNA_START=44 /DNA_END=427 /DNA_ORIENTATION=-